MAKKFVFEIESYEGITMMAFEATITGNEIEITKTMDCSHADTDGDYIFDTDADLYRIQSDIYKMKGAYV